MRIIIGWVDLIWIGVIVISILWCVGIVIVDKIKKLVRKGKDGK